MIFYPELLSLKSLLKGINTESSAKTAEIYFNQSLKAISARLIFLIPLTLTLNLSLSLTLSIGNALKLLPCLFLLEIGKFMITKEKKRFLNLLKLINCSCSLKISLLLVIACFGCLLLKQVLLKVLTPEIINLCWKMTI